MMMMVRSLANDPALMVILRIIMVRVMPMEDRMEPNLTAGLRRARRRRKTWQSPSVSSFTVVPSRI
jgi:hypothetical protein